MTVTAAEFETRYVFLLCNKIKVIIIDVGKFKSNKTK